MNAKELLAKLTLEEKISLCIGSGPWQTVEIERLNIPKITLSDGPHGVRKVQNIKENGLANSIPATCYPTAAILASTWDLQLVQDVGDHLGEECLSLDVDILLGPGINIKRTPLCGRNFEYFSEDPFLSGEMGLAMVNGVQGKGIGTSLKHFTANNQEYQRFTISAEIDERTLREIYLSAFERVVRKGQPWTVMCAYNRINGVFASEHQKLLSQILKSEWNFEGFVVSDWGAVHDRVAALKGGLDLQMPGPSEFDAQSCISAIMNGKLDEKTLDEAVERILKIVFRSKKVIKGNFSFNRERHHEFARKVASEGIILLKNKNKILPLHKNSSIAIIGRMAKEPRFQGGGSSIIKPTMIDVPFDEIKKIFEGNKILYAPGYSKDNKLDNSLIEEACKVAEQVKIVVLFVGMPLELETEGFDRTNIDLPKSHILLINEVSKVNSQVIVVLNNSSAIDMHKWIDNVSGVIEAYLPGQAGGGAIADILFGKINPSGKLAETFPIKLSHTPSFINYPGQEGKVRYGEGLYVGYRYYEKKEIDPLFPFGYGLSYTTFTYSNLTVSKKEFTDTEGLDVNVDITNEGEVLGKEIVQIYIHQNQPKIDRPYKELKGFKKVELRPGETKRINIHLDPRAFAYYSIRANTWIFKSGEYIILVGSSSRDISLKTTVYMNSHQKLPSSLNMDSTIREWLSNGKGKQIINELWKQRAKYDPNYQELDEKQREEEFEKIGDISLLKILRWAGDSLPMSAEEFLKTLLAQIKEDE